MMRMFFNSQGNEFFKQKKYNEAIDCYSRSIAFSPTAVAYANRGMAYLKIKRCNPSNYYCALLIHQNVFW